MRTRRLAFTLLALLVLGAAVAAMVRYTRNVEGAMSGTAVDGGTVTLLRERAPVADFTVADLAGRPLSLSAMKGKVVLVNFWATWCPPCREEIPDLIALQARYKDQLQIIGVSQDSGTPEEVARFAVEHGMNYPIVMSTPELERLFPNVYALPTTFVIDRDGKVAQKHVGMLNAARTEAEARVLAGLKVNAKIEYADDNEKVRLQNAAQANKIPGVDLSALTPDQRAKVLQRLNSQQCSCGCGQTVAQCRLEDPTCDVSLPLAQEIVKQITAGR